MTTTTMTAIGNNISHLDEDEDVSFLQIFSSLPKCSLSAATKPVLKRVAKVVDHENHDEKLRKTSDDEGVSRSRHICCIRGALHCAICIFALTKFMLDYFAFFYPVCI